MSKGIETITVSLQETFSIYIVIVLWVIGYLLLDKLLERINANQKVRRKQANVRISQLKEPWRTQPAIMEEKEKTIEKTEKMWAKYDNLAQLITSEDKWRLFKIGFAQVIANNRWIETLRMEKHMNDEEIARFQQESKTIIKEEKSFAMIPILLFMGKLTIFIFLLRTFTLLEDIPFSQMLVIVTTIVSFFALVTRKTMVLFLLFAVLSLIFYPLLSGTALYFLLIYWLLKGVQFRTKQWRNRKSTSPTQEKKE